MVSLWLKFYLRENRLTLTFALDLINIDPSIDREKMEKEEMDRMKERMTLAHKNTSKWARRVLRRGAKMDPDERRALSLQIAKGDELRRKVMGEDSGDEQGSHDEDDSEEVLLKKAKDILSEKCDITEESLGKRKGLFELDFMKRGMEQQRARAKEEARRLLEELEANEAAMMPTDSDDDSDRETPTKKITKPKVASEEETTKVLPEGKLVASSLEFGKSDAFGVTLANNDDVAEITQNEMEDIVDTTASSSNKRKKKNKKKKGRGDNEDDSNAVPVEEEENPWLAAAKDGSTSASKSKPPAAKKAKTSSVKIDINAAASLLVDVPAKKTQEKVVDSAAQMETPKRTDVGLASLSQAELVKCAFASPDDLEAEREFQEEKVCLLFCVVTLYLHVCQT
jgi:U3 small nucleolar RNA-associated protein 14